MVVALGAQVSPLNAELTLLREETATALNPDEEAQP